ncbi:MAG: glycosyl hydrolase, partial [Acidimicrobiia bacterium]
MMTDIDTEIDLASLGPLLDRLWDLSGPKVKRLCTAYPAEAGTPVYTVAGKYTARSWTEWTEGFLYGWAILHFDATNDTEALELGRTLTRDRMGRHLTHMGVHDHGFNNVRTYGNLRR